MHTCCDSNFLKRIKVIVYYIQRFESRLTYNCVTKDLKDTSEWLKYTILKQLRGPKKLQ